jgi:hypothetical protein
MTELTIFIRSITSACFIVDLIKCNGNLWADIYICVRDVDFDFISTIFDEILELFRQCGIFVSFYLKGKYLIKNSYQYLIFYAWMTIRP